VQWYATFSAVPSGFTDCFIFLYTTLSCRGTVTFYGRNFTKICSFLFPSNREGRYLAGDLFGAPRYVECADDVEACVDVSERAGDAVRHV
jgi:hypothetical protein